jgi:hypothetical protein
VITITPSGGLTGSVALTCAVTAQPAGAVNPPTCSISQLQPIAGTQAVSATLTVGTHGATTKMLNRFKGGPLGLGGGVVAALVFFCVPIQRPKWQTMVCPLFVTMIVAAAGGCGSSGSSVPNPSTPSNPSDPPSTATTPGNYAVTVTGTNGSQQVTTAIVVTVQ